IIMISILRHKKLNVSLVATKKVSRECALVKDYIDKNFKNSISLDDLATFSHLNKYYLVHNFSKSYGLSPINYLLEKRINESKFLLDSTSYSLSQISQIVGFSSSSYFSQSFKRAMGISPMEFRKRTTNK
ncbi:MAG: AraC family transcriptional regulator, partial [Oscillospiraceae bacterium]